MGENFPRFARSVLIKTNLASHLEQNEKREKRRIKKEQTVCALDTCTVILFICIKNRKSRIFQSRANAIESFGSSLVNTTKIINNKL